MARLKQLARTGLFALFSVIFVMASGPASAAPYAAMVIDARSGEVLHARNADARLHPASLTKMMTLYVVFEAVEHGEISLDTEVTISKHAASEPPSKLGLRAGQRIKLRYLIRAAAVKSANDAATALGEAISGSESAFAARMNRTAKALGMNSTNFRNAHGLTADGHLSTARDMTTLGRHLFYDYPEYYNLFSRRTADAGVRQVPNTNTRFLNAYKGADGIKTGYTRAAGFNLVASAQRGQERIIATVFGGASTADRNARVAELLDMGFNRAPTRVAVVKPRKPAYAGPGTAVAQVYGDSEDAPVVRASTLQDGRMPAGKVIRVSINISASPRPKARPGTQAPVVNEEVLLAMQNDILEAVTLAQAEPEPDPEADAAVAAAVENAAETALAEAATEAEPEAEVQVAEAEAEAEPEVQVAEAAETPEPEAPELRVAEAEEAAPETEAPAEEEILLAEAEEVAPEAEADAAEELVEVARAAADLTIARPKLVQVPAAISKAHPKLRPEGLQFVSASPAQEIAPKPAEPEIVTRLSTSGGRGWGINVGTFGSRYQAERVLLKTALQELDTLDTALRKVAQTARGFDANFVGMNEETAALACRRLQARNLTCNTFGPSS